MTFSFQRRLHHFWVPAAIIAAGAAGVLFGSYLSGIMAIFSSIEITQPATTFVMAAVAIIIALLNPSWQSHIWGPRLRVEIATIERKLDQDKAVINLSDVPQYHQLNEIFYQLDAEDFVRNTLETDSDRSKSKKSKQQALEDSGRHEIKLHEFNAWREEIKLRLSDMQEKLNKITADIGKFSEPESKFEKSDIYEVNRKYNLGLNLEKLWKADISAKPEGAKEFIERIVLKCRKMFDSYQEAAERCKYCLQQLDHKYGDIERKIWETKSLFYVSATIINSGRNASAIKAPALLWIDLGSGRRVDLELVIENFKEESEVRAGGVRVAVFKSPLIEAMPEFNRQHVNRYWNQALNAKLFIQDINSRNHMSKGTLFASGLYQRDVYEQLLRFAEGSANSS